MHPDQAEMTLRDYGAVVWRRKWIVVVAALLATAIAVGLSVLQTPIYSASAEILVQPRGQDGLFEGQIVGLNDRSIQTEIQVIEGEAVRNRVQQDVQLSEPPPDVEATTVGQTDVIEVAVRSSSAGNARTLADAYAEAYIAIRLEQSVNELLAASTEVQNAIDDLQEQIDELADDDPRRTTLFAQLGNFNTTLDQLRVDSALRTGGAVIIKSAELPESPVEPTPLRSAMLALVVGLLLGLGAAFLLDYLDDKVRTPEDVEAFTRRPILAEVPVDPPPSNLPISVSHPEHASVEAYRGLRTNLQFLALDQELKVIQVTSSLAGEGKTTTATNLASVLARAGNKVALLDADLRRPRVHEVFGLQPTPGLTDMLLGGAPKQSLQRVDIGGGDTLSVYTSGEIPSNPSEMLSGQRMRRLLRSMGEHYDFVVVDSAPILPVSDSVALSGSVDGVIVVAHAGRVTTGELAETMERLERVAAPVLGLALNQANAKTRDTYAYGGYAAAPGDRSAGDVTARDEPEPDVDTTNENENVFSDL